MTNLISTTSSSAKPDAAPESPTASNNQSELVIVAPEPSLESRTNARRAELIFKLTELRASTHLAAVEAGDKIKARLSELSHIVREGVVDGWAHLGVGVTAKLERWLAESAPQLAFQAKGPSQ